MIEELKKKPANAVRLGGMRVSFNKDADPSTVKGAIDGMGNVARNQVSSEGKYQNGRTPNQVVKAGLTRPDYQSLWHKGGSDSSPESGGMYTKENSPGMGWHERQTYNSELLSNKRAADKNSTDLAVTRIGGQNRIDVANLNNSGAMARDMLSEEGKNSRLGGELNFKGQQSSLDRQHEAGMQGARIKNENNNAELEREFKAGESSLDREAEVNKQKREIAGQAVLGGMKGDDAQQIQNSRNGDINYKGLNMPEKDNWQPYKDENGNVVGSVNRKTGERKKYTGEMNGETFDPQNPTPEQVQYLKDLRETDPEEYNRIRSMFSS